MSSPIVYCHSAADAAAAKSSNSSHSNEIKSGSNTEDRIQSDTLNSCTPCRVAGTVIFLTASGYCFLSASRAANKAGSVDFRLAIGLGVCFGLLGNVLFYYF